MSDIHNAECGCNNDFVHDAPPTQPQGSPEAPMLQNVQGAEELLRMLEDEQAPRELYAYFGAKSADDLAETDRREFIRLAKMSCEDRANVVGSKRTASPPIAVEPNGNTTITMRDKAVALAELGFRVFPVKQGTKAPAQPPNKPRPPKGQYHQHIPSSDPADVAAMWTGPRGESLTFDIGINTEGLLVLDIDDRDGRTGTASFAELVRTHGLDPDTVVASTPSGGRHYFYKLPADIDPATVKFGSDKLGSGIDHRSYNSLVVGAGTVRPGKGEYKWVRSPAEYEMKEPPMSLVELCRRARVRDPQDPIVVPGLEIDSPEAIERFRRYVQNHAPEAVQNAGGRNATIAVLRRAGDYGLSYSGATEILCEEGGWNEVKALPPWDENELLELAETLEPSRERPIGCEHPAAYFEAVEIGEGTGAAAPPRGDESPESEPELRLPFISAAAWHGLPIPEREWVLRDRIPMRNVTLLAGDGGVGKTILHLQAGTAIVLGREWLGIPTEPGPVAVVCCEDDADELHRRIALIANHYQVGLSDLEDLHLLPLVDGHDTVLAVPDGNGQIRPTKMFARLHEAVCDIRPRLLTIDNLADVFGGNEINRVQVRQFVTLLRKLAVAAGGATLLTAHPSLTGMASGSGTSGSTGWHNSARARMYMTKAEGGGEPDPNLRLLKTMKSNYGPPSEEIKLRWCNGVWAPVHARLDRAAVAQEAERVFLILLERFTNEGRNISANLGPTYAPTQFAKEAEAGQVGITKKDLEAAMRRLFDGGKIRTENYGRPSRPSSRLVPVAPSN